MSQGWLCFILLRCQRGKSKHCRPHKHNRYDMNLKENHIDYSETCKRRNDKIKPPTASTNPTQKKCHVGVVCFMLLWAWFGDRSSLKESSSKARTIQDFRLLYPIFPEWIFSTLIPHRISFLAAAERIVTRAGRSRIGGEVVHRIRASAATFIMNASNVRMPSTQAA